MDIKTRIDGLTEAEAKAALSWCLEIFARMKKKESEYMAGFQNVHPVEYYENEILDEAIGAIKEARK